MIKNLSGYQNKESQMRRLFLIQKNKPSAHFNGRQTIIGVETCNKISNQDFMTSNYRRIFFKCSIMFCQKKKKKEWKHSYIKTCRVNEST